MSDNHSELPDIGTRYNSAEELVQSILDDHNSAPSEISPSGELYRAIERFHANAHRRPGLVNSARRDLIRSHINRWASSSSSSAPTPTPGSSRRAATHNMSSDPNPNLEPYRRFSREPQPSGAPTLPPLRSLTGSRHSPGIMVPGRSARRGRWRATERISGRHRIGTSTHNNDLLNESNGLNHEESENLEQLLLLEQHDGRRPRLGRSERDIQSLHDLDDANNQLQALLDFTNPPSHPYSDLSFPSPPLQASDSANENRRVKRRKLDTDRLSTGFRGFCYGKYGQVEPGGLTMEIASCDGGIYSDDGQAYAVENVLKNDHTVYCTKGPRCNIVLRHQGSTVFTLKELIIRAPRSNYTSPVQEGMIFISMDQDELLSRTAQYRIPSMPFRYSRRLQREAQPLAPILSIRHNEDGSTMTRAQVRARRLYDIDAEEEDGDYRVAQLPTEFTASPAQLHVTAVCSDDEDELALRSGWRAPNRIGSLPFESDDSSGDELADQALYGIDHQRQRRRRTFFWEMAEDAADTGAESSHSVAQAGCELMAPHARFFIERDKSKCTIKFDPPVSGRFVLIKMWSPNLDPASNIDIQGISAIGFAGPRFFPSVELR